MSTEEEEYAKILLEREKDAKRDWEHLERQARQAKSHYEMCHQYRMDWQAFHITQKKSIPG